MTATIEWLSLVLRLRICDTLTIFIDNFVTCCYQVTKVFCSKYCIASALPARSPCNLGSLADFPISVFWEVSIHTVLPRYHFSMMFGI